MPSPALMMRDRQMRASRWQAPDEPCRITIMSGDIASMFIAVSTSVSPLTTLEEAMAMLSVSALSRFSAISNDVRVRVLGSKNRFTTVRPRSVGTFLMGRAAISFIASAVSRIEQDLLARQIGDAEHVPARAARRRPRGPGDRLPTRPTLRHTGLGHDRPPDPAASGWPSSSTTSSTPSISCSRT